MSIPAGSEFNPPNSVREALGFDGEHLLRSENSKSVAAALRSIFMMFPLHLNVN